MDPQRNALRAAETALIAGVWLVASGLLMAYGQIVWSEGQMKLGVTFPHMQVMITNLVCGTLGAVLAAARAWGRQPPAISHFATMAGVFAAALPVFTHAPEYMQQHNVLAGLALAVAAAISASAHPGRIGDRQDVPPWEAWGQGGTATAAPAPAERDQATDPQAPASL